MSIKFEMDEEKHVKVLDALLGDADLMMALNAVEDFEAGYRLVAERVPGLTLEEFAGSMEMLRQIVMAQMEKGPVQ
ncbi:hypothetical protein [Acetobacterium sp.]|jgi:hypothetical protein|uniref:hypothetical protein n=1 Tax=Acetobacterium sp. TaxID=1872094 RepID=UPI000CC15F13|nr:hypothetical protein [Acetobacterium sp.]MDO9492786.1 hypothetical protein [Acetobacterium sp.]PKM71451.1 MAG: hypothetical protein CVU92_08395 [Firmicutes bacterium HGW-Firmicutes-17]